jgi:hypothetical protein
MLYFLAAEIHCRVFIVDWNVPCNLDVIVDKPLDWNASELRSRCNVPIQPTKVIRSVGRWQGYYQLHPDWKILSEVTIGIRKTFSYLNLFTGRSKDLFRRSSRHHIRRICCIHRSAQI